jgi:hypothetical protein
MEASYNIKEQARKQNEADRSQDCEKSQGNHRLNSLLTVACLDIFFGCGYSGIRCLVGVNKVKPGNSFFSLRYAITVYVMQ